MPLGISMSTALSYDLINSMHLGKKREKRDFYTRCSLSTSWSTPPQPTECWPRSILKLPPRCDVMHIHTTLGGKCQVHTQSAGFSDPITGVFHQNPRVYLPLTNHPNLLIFTFFIVH